MMSGTNASPLLSLPDVIGYETLPWRLARFAICIRQRYTASMRETGFGSFYPVYNMTIVQSYNGLICVEFVTQVADE